MDRNNLRAILWFLKIIREKINNETLKQKEIRITREEVEDMIKKLEHDIIILDYMY